MPIAGNFAPPIDPHCLDTYYTLGEAIEDAGTQRAYFALALLVSTAQAFPVQQDTKHPHPCGTGTIIPLSPGKMTALVDLIPSKESCDAIGQQFNHLKGETRNAAYHLLWYAREYSLGREPITTDLI